MSLMTSTSMDGKPYAEQSAAAIAYILRQIRDNPSVGWFLGMGTETFSLLTEAYATFTGHTVEYVRREYQPVNARNPREDNGVKPEDFTLSDQRFFKFMERELVANQNKGDWRDWKPDRMACVDEVFHHARKLRRALSLNDQERVNEHAADLANIAMKTAEVHGDLKH